MRSVLLLIHRWLGVLTGAIIFIIAVTGSALVFEGAIDRGLNPGLYRVAPRTATLPLDTLIARAQSVARGAPVRSLQLARAPGRAYMAQAGAMQIFIDPFTGRVLGTRATADFDRSLPRVLHRMHTSLLAPRRGGGAVVVVCTIAALLLVMTGVIIWWREKLWRIVWGASWKRVVYDLHHLLGILAALVLLVITSSGTIIHFESLGKAIAGIGSGPPAPAPQQIARDAGAALVSIDSITRAAQRTLPDASLTFVNFDATPTRPAVVGMRYPEDRTPAGRSRVYVDRFTGSVLRADATRQAPAGLKLANQMRSVHTGDILGPPTQMIWLLSAIILASQAVTGLMMWYHMRPARVALDRKAERDAAS